jgi:GT2 family glycosyltransferase
MQPDTGPGAARRHDELDVTVVLPAYNEAGHVREEVDRIGAALKDSTYAFEILVVDDGSTDGTTASYQPNAGFCGADSFNYTLNSGSAAVVSVTVFARAATSSGRIRCRIKSPGA